MRVVAACLVLFAACSEYDPHALGACDPRWNTPGVEPQRCEAACEKPRDTPGPRCDATFAIGGDGRTLDPDDTTCPATFAIDEFIGCCHPGGTADAPMIQFYE